MTEDWKKYVVEDSNITIDISSMPKLSKWQCHLTEGPYGLTLTVAEGKEPRWIHRKMQEICFGFKWRKMK